MEYDINEIMKSGGIQSEPGLEVASACHRTLSPMIKEPPLRSTHQMRTGLHCCVTMYATQRFLMDHGENCGIVVLGISHIRLK